MAGSQCNFTAKIVTRITATMKSGKDINANDTDVIDHTLLVDVPRIGEYKILGESLDDAVGEGFDKTAKILGLGYPGGPALANLAKQGDKNRFTFPRPMTDRPGLDFSFSGLKTYARNTFIDFPEEKANIAKAFEVAATETLTIKCNRALKQTGYKTLVVAGGVCIPIRRAF